MRIKLTNLIPIKSENLHNIEVGDRVFGTDNVELIHLILSKKIAGVNKEHTLKKGDYLGKVYYLHDDGEGLDVARDDYIEGGGFDNTWECNIFGGYDGYLNNGSSGILFLFKKSLSELLEEL